MLLTPFGSVKQLGSFHSEGFSGALSPAIPLSTGDLLRIRDALFI